ncbi:cytochrome c550 [Virgibacillus soli]|uniref:Cytochrome c n=1 Tax=Paracerasibacillus soli TaxID=480284 RepID=A0ABU5CSR0_9BACI|nr:cytochrome c [Virgibacillus soli]MDY0408460.1 cytochrome c [Virgibacillus soli]
MKRNPVIPYAIIAVVGILAIIIISSMGIGHRDAIQGKDDDEAGQTETTLDDPEEIYQNNCAACHGADLSGGMGPGLDKVGSKHDADEIVEIIHNGLGNMPPQNVADEEAKILAEWLSEKK